ncbi:MAG: hypothetical protein GWO04_32180, partial [Actinobacteria bacterium]|nr:hypothetical protein [Actinomycetota bacterium]NIS34318.1 hypothetical protein [Actinomycetota bacterium]
MLADFGTSGDAGAIPPASDFSSPDFAGLALRFPAAARYTRLRQLVEPVSLDIPALVLDVEDHATNLAEVLWST